MTPHEQYPGLFEAFCKFYREQSLKHGEDERFRDQHYLRLAFNNRLQEGNIIVYTDPAEAKIAVIPFPPYLLALRDMSLI